MLQMLLEKTVLLDFLVSSLMVLPLYSYLLFAMLIASVLKKQVPGEALFRTAVYAKVLMFAVATVLDLIPLVDLSVPFLFRVAITTVFMGFAIAKLPDNRPTPAPMTMGQGW